jgi:hypothetical protein
MPEPAEPHLCSPCVCCRGVILGPSANGTSNAGSQDGEYIDSDGVKTSQSDGRIVMGPVWDAAKAMGLCCGFPVEGK